MMHVVDLYSTRLGLAGGSTVLADISRIAPSAPPAVPLELLELPE
jgi:hypothetical protein